MSSRTRTSVDDLAPEILVAVFRSLAAPLSDSLAYWRTWLTTLHQRITISHVCSYWRAVILNVPDFWSTITVGASTSSKVPDWLREELVKRSHESPLHLIAHPYNLGDNDVTAIISLLPRIESLRSNYSHENWQAGAHDAPLLKELSIARFWPTPTLSPVPFINPTFALPHLVDLHFQGIAYPKALPFFRPTLRKFSLECPDDSDRPRLSLGDVNHFIHALQSMPLLEDLCLVTIFGRCYSEQLNFAVGDLPTVRLEHLRQLELRDNLRICAHILQFVEFPTSTFLDGSCRFGDDDTKFSGIPIVDQLQFEGPLQFVQVIFGKLGGQGLIGASPPQIQKLNTRFTFDTTRRGCISMYFINNEDIPIFINTIENTYIPPDAILKGLFSCPHDDLFSNILSLSFQEPAEQPVADWRRFGLPSNPSAILAQKLINLQDLRLMNAPGMAWWFVELHGNCGLDNRKLLSEMLPFPNLRTLCLGKVTFDKRHGLVLLREDFIRMLQRTFHIRGFAGFRRLESLIFYDTVHFANADVEALGEHVDEVIIHIQKDLGWL